MPFALVAAATSRRSSALTERVRLALAAAVGPTAARVWVQGSRLGIDEAIAHAFGADRPRTDAPDGLSDREVEVAGLVAHAPRVLLAGRPAVHSWTGRMVGGR
jgi:hypothetical protein